MITGPFSVGVRTTDPACAPGWDTSAANESWSGVSDSRWEINESAHKEISICIDAKRVLTAVGLPAEICRPLTRLR